MPAALLLPLLSLLACTSKPSDTSTADGGGTTTTDTSDPPVVPVWTEASFQTSKTVTGIFVSGADEAWVSLSGGETRLYQSGSWTNVSIDVMGQDLNGIWGSGTGSTATVVTVGNSGYIGTWSGSLWEVDDVGTANFESVDGPFASDLIAVGWGGIYTNETGDWVYQNIPGGHRFNHVWYDGAAGAIVGEEGILGRLVEGAWEFTQESERRAFYGVSGTSANDIWAVGEKGTVLHWDGTAWNDESPAGVSSKGIWAVWAPNASNVFIVGANGLAMVRRDGQWVDLPTGVTRTLYAIGGTGLNDVWAGGSFGTVLRYQP